MFTFEKISKLSDLEIIIYNYIVEHPDEILEMSIQKLASQTHVSTTTILRFCHSLGLKGYSEFKLRFKDDQKNKNTISTNSFYQDITYLEKYTEPEFQKKN